MTTMSENYLNKKAAPTPTSEMGEPPCDSKIFSNGHLLHTVQLAQIFNDSKTFVDLPLKYEPDVVLANFDAMMATYEGNPSREDIVDFVNANYEQTSTELEFWSPDDFHENPKFLNRISDPKLKTWAQSLHNFWGELGRKINPEVKLKPDQHSLLYVPNPVIVPGGRFKEFYYWDSYWIQEGLLLSELNHTVKGMIRNFVGLVNQIGFVPNGGRIYYHRSQPPLLIPMVKNYLDATNDLDFLHEVIHALDTEFHFWIQRRMVTVHHNGKDYQMARYNSTKNGPRPESYVEDLSLASQLETEEEKRELYYNLHSGAESGWDFSTRWFIPPSGKHGPGDLLDIKTRHIIPVDLNALLYYNAKLMSNFYDQIGNAERSEYYFNYAKAFRTAINEVLWDESQGSWFDYDLINKRLRKVFHPSNIVPLWAGVQESQFATKQVINYLKNSSVLTYPSGVPTSLVHSAEQWDSSNGWAPLQSFVVQALERCGDREAKFLAFELADKWLRTNYEAFYQTIPNSMFEKYDVTTIGLPGGGGEYDIQIGFGWTNGVVLDFLNRYGDKLNSKNWSWFNELLLKYGY